MNEGIDARIPGGRTPGLDNAAGRGRSRWDVARPWINPPKALNVPPVGPGSMGCGHLATAAKSLNRAADERCAAARHSLDLLME